MKWCMDQTASFVGIRVGLPPSHRSGRLATLAQVRYIFAAMPQLKRKYVQVEDMELRIAMEPHVSQSAAARLLQQPHGQQKRQTKRLGTSLRHARRRFNRIVEQHCVANTAYGPVVKHFDIDLSDGGQMQVEYLCPFAWMHYLCVQCSAWAQFLSRMCGQGSPGQDMRDGQGSPGQDLRGSVCIYSDDVMPGNVLRPDKGRSFLALYWGIVELPDWWRSRGRFWQTLLFLPTEQVKKSKEVCQAFM